MRDIMPEALKESAKTRQADSVTVEFEKQADEIITHYPVSKRSAAVPLLHLWQRQFGHVDDSGTAWIAAKLEVSPIDLYELLTFYPWFRREAAGRTIVRVCRTLSCALNGSHEVKRKFCECAGVDLDAESHGFGAPPPTSADGKFSVEFVECLASCGTGPAVLINDDLHENVTPEQVPALIERYAK